MMNISINISYLNSLLLANIRSTFLIDSLSLYLIVPIGIISTFLNIITILILLNKKFNNINIFKLMKVYSLTSCFISFTMIFSGLLFTPHILFDLSISKFARIYTCNIVSWIIVSLFSYGNCLDILMNKERALSFSNKYHKIKQISPYLICFIILILSLIIFIPNLMSLKWVQTDQIYTLKRITTSTDFALSKLGKILLIISYTLEGPVVFILLIATNILAVNSYRKFNQRKELIDQTNNIEMLAEGELRKKSKIEKTDRKLLMMTSYLSLISILTDLLQFTTLFFYLI